MTLAIHTPPPAPTPTLARRTQRLGDTVSALAHRYAAEMNQSAMSVALRERHLSRRSYRGMIATMYPVVVGFNGALIRSIAKVDHVRNSSFVRVLARQLEEEQAHNALWRSMLDSFDIDHERLYDDLDEFRDGIGPDELDRRSRAVLASVRHDLRAGAANEHFGSEVFPDAVLALAHHLWESATDDAVSYWSHFASQAGIEMVIFDVVSASILPGVLGHPELDLGISSTRWWQEHGIPPVHAEDRTPTDEEKHLSLSRAALNRNETANALAAEVARRAEDTMRLFAATLIGQRPQEHAFPVEQYLKGGSHG